MQAGAMGADKQDWTTFCSEAKRNAFLIGDLGRNAYGSNYHVREPETQRLPMAFPGFVDSIKAWQSRRLLFQVPQHNVMITSCMIATSQIFSQCPDPICHLLLRVLKIY